MNLSEYIIFCMLLILLPPALLSPALLLLAKMFFAHSAPHRPMYSKDFRKELHRSKPGS